MAAEEVPAPRRGSRLKLWFVLIVLASLAAFSWLNQQKVPIYPLRYQVPLYAVVLACLGVGFLLGFIVRSFLARRQKVKVSIT
jgi:hypothetical protein